MPGPAYTSEIRNVALRWACVRCRKVTVTHSRGPLSLSGELIYSCIHCGTRNELLVRLNVLTMPAEEPSAEGAKEVG